MLRVDLVRAANELQLESDVTARLDRHAVEEVQVLRGHRLEGVAGRPAARADDPARRREPVVEVAAVDLADEVRLRSDPWMLHRRQLL